MKKLFFIGLPLGVVAALFALRFPPPATTPPPPPVPVITSSPAPAAVVPPVRGAPVSMPRPDPAPTSDNADPLRLKLAVWRQAPDSSNYESQFRLLEEIRSLITDSNAPEVAKSLSDQDLAGQVGFAALQHWLATDPKAATQWLAARGGATDEHASMVTQKLMDDPQGLKDYLGSLPDGDEWKKKMLATAGSEMAAKDPQQAIDFATNLDSSPVKSAFLASAAQQWAAGDPAAAMTWAASTNADPGLREQMIAAVAKGAADPIRWAPRIGWPPRSKIRSWSATSRKAWFAHGWPAIPRPRATG